jgi:hypothetical protein
MIRFILNRVTCLDDDHDHQQDNNLVSSSVICGGSRINIIRKKQPNIYAINLPILGGKVVLDTRQTFDQQISKLVDY